MLVGILIAVIRGSLYHKQLKKKLQNVLKIRDIQSDKQWQFVLQAS